MLLFTVKEWVCRSKQKVDGNNTLLTARQDSKERLKGQFKAKTREQGFENQCKPFKKHGKA